MLGSWSESIECELREIRAQSEHRREHFPVEEVQSHEMDALFALLNGIFEHKNETRKAKLILQVRTKAKLSFITVPPLAADGQAPP